LFILAESRQKEVAFYACSYIYAPLIVFLSLSLLQYMILNETQLDFVSSATSSGSSKGRSSDRRPLSMAQDDHLLGSSVSSLAGFISGHFSADDRMQIAEVW
jgi:hypothetical protein